MFWGELSKQLCDLVLFESDTVEGLKKQFHEAVDDYIKLLKTYKEKEQYYASKMQKNSL